MTPRQSRPGPGGFTLIEMIVSMAIGMLVIAGLGGVVSGALANRDHVAGRIAATRDAEFAMQRMVAAVAGASRLLVPRAENPLTLWSEAAREPGVLAVTLDPSVDRDHDGIADGDNDGDGRVDEDSRGDLSYDGAAGIVGIDDDGDGLVDEGILADDDDEDGFANEDPSNGIDDDGDGAVDEDPPADANADGKPGVQNVDDDGDGTVDEGTPPDDDEDGVSNEDWPDIVVYFLNGGTLVERMPDLGAASGTNYTERAIAEGVTRFRVERVAPAQGARAVVVELTLDLAPAGGETVSLSTRARVGGRQ